MAELNPNFCYCDVCNRRRVEIARASATTRSTPALPKAVAPVPDSHAGRKQRPVCTGVLDYFPDALLEVAYCSFIANEQHNPGEPMHWAKDKSIGRGDEIIRHLIDRGKTDSDGIRHSAKLAWRALELLQREIEAERAQNSTAATDAAPQTKISDNKSYVRWDWDGF